MRLVPFGNGTPTAAAGFSHDLRFPGQIYDAAAQQRLPRLFPDPRPRCRERPCRSGGITGSSPASLSRRRAAISGRRWRRASLRAASAETLAQAGIAAERIDAIFLTGGSTAIPAVREAVTAIAPRARIVEGDMFGSVGLGLGLDAARRFS
jgi:hypothetical protein